MSKRCKLRKEYYQQYGNYKGSGKYSDNYVEWLEDKILAFQKKDTKSLKCNCKTPLLITRTVDADFNFLCERCGKPL